MSIDAIQWTECSPASRAGVYMLLLGNEIQYVGQSVNIDVRLCDHRREGRITFDAVRVALLSEGLDETEKELIQKHQPPFNRTHTEKAKLPRGRQNEYPRSVRWTGDNYQHAVVMAALEDRSVNQWLNLTVERLWLASTHPKDSTP